MVSHTGYERTLRTLLASPNRAATDLLVLAAQSPTHALRIGAIRALAQRNDTQGHRWVVESHREIAPDALLALAATEPGAPLRTTLESLVGSSEPAVSDGAVEVAKLMGCHGALAAITQLAIGTDDPRRARVAAEAALLLAEGLRKRIDDWSGAGEKTGVDPAFERRSAIAALSEALDDYPEHRLDALLGALLWVAPHDEPRLIRALRDPGHGAHNALLDALRTATSGGVAAILAGVIVDPTSPEALLQIAVSRVEPAMLDSILRRIQLPLGARAAKNAARIESAPWLEPSRKDLVASLSQHAQSVVVELALASGAKGRDVAGLIDRVLETGPAEARLHAVKALAKLSSHLAAQPLERALGDEDPAVAAVATRLLRQKELPDATTKLVELLDHEANQVRAAAQKALHEVSFSSLRDAFPYLTPEERRSAGRLVAKADPLAIASVRAELGSGAVSRRLQGLEWVEAMEIYDQLADRLVAMLSDADAGVRSESARLLGEALPTRELLAGLTEATRDRSSAVRAAATASLLRHEHALAAIAGPIAGVGHDSLLLGKESPL